MTGSSRKPLARFSQREQRWIDAGYDIFSRCGPDALRIEALARHVGVSKSSFYHHFADIEVFSEQLLKWHLHRAEEIARQTRACQSFEPDFLAVLEAHRQDLSFNQWLRIHRTTQAFQHCYQQAQELVDQAAVPLWITSIGLESHPDVARHIYRVMTDIFYQRMTPETLTTDWMGQFLGEIRHFLKDVVRGKGMFPA